MARLPRTAGGRRAEAPARPGRQTSFPGVLPMLWLICVAAALIAIGAVRFVDLPEQAGPAAASALATLYAVGLAVRTGGRPWLPLLLAGGLGGAAVGTMDERLLAGAAVSTAIVSAVLAVVATVPAPTFAATIREVLVATAVATAGGFAVAGFGATMHPARFDYVVLVAALLATALVVFRLGAGFHGLGRRGYIICGTALVVLVVALAYSEALGRWGSAEMVTSVDDFKYSVRDLLGGVPHPIEAAFGLPALAWGVFMRARRRQGWWVGAFGAGATAAAAGRFVEITGPLATVLGAVYSLVVGLLIGYVVIRIEQAITGSHGSRARRDEEAAAHRPEPSRFRPLQ